MVDNDIGDVREPDDRLFSGVPRRLSRRRRVAPSRCDQHLKPPWKGLEMGIDLGIGSTPAGGTHQ